MQHNFQIILNLCVKGGSDKAPKSSLETAVDFVQSQWITLIFMSGGEVLWLTLKIPVYSVLMTATIFSKNTFKRLADQQERDAIEWFDVGERLFVCIGIQLLVPVYVAITSFKTVQVFAEDYHLYIGPQPGFDYKRILKQPLSVTWRDILHMV